MFWKNFKKKLPVVATALTNALISLCQDIEASLDLTLRRAWTDFDTLY